jgi:hypothetical protein
VAESPNPTSATITAARPIAGASEVDLLGRIGAAIPVEADGGLRIPLGAWEIRTFRVGFVGAGGTAAGSLTSVERTALPGADTNVDAAMPL